MKWIVALAASLAFGSSRGISPAPASICREAEKIVFEFQTRGKKLAGICSGGSGETEYILYRFGTPAKVELEFPKEKDSSYSRFHFAYYLRGGGPENEGLDANYLSFQIDSVKYEIYEERSASSPVPSVGIKVILSKSKKPVVIQGAPATIKGTLLTLRDEHRLRQAD